MRYLGIHFDQEFSLKQNARIAAAKAMSKLRFLRLHDTTDRKHDRGRHRRFDTPQLTCELIFKTIVRSQLTMHAKYVDSAHKTATRILNDMDYKGIKRMLGAFPSVAMHDILSVAGP